MHAGETTHSGEPSQPTRSSGLPGPASGPGTPEEWARFLESHLDCRVGVTFGRSLSYPIQVRSPTPGKRPASGLVVRMHSMFADASHEVAESVATWIRSGRRARRACNLLDTWIEERMAALPPRKPRRTPARPRGETYDLETLAAPLLAGLFTGDFTERPAPDLTWGRRGKSRTRRSLRLGSFDVEDNLVRIHPVLDQPGVPEWFVRYVLFHEILHAAHPPVRNGSRWVHHGPEFRRRERAYEDYTRALEWEEANLPRLIRSARNGTALRVTRPKRRIPPVVAPRPVRGFVQGLFGFD